MKASEPNFGITVVTPSLNQGLFLRNCLRSVVLQEPNFPFEQIVVDGGSADDTKQIVGEFTHARFVDLPGSSQSEALNEGFRQARYPVICWLNADDFLLPEAFRQAHHYWLNKTRERFYLFSSFVAVDREGHYLSMRRVPPVVIHILRNFGVYVPTSGAFFCKQIVDDGLLLEADLHYLMDRDFLIRLSQHGYHLKRLPRSTVAFRLHETQKSRPNNDLPQQLRECDTLHSAHGGVWLKGKRVLDWNKGFYLLGWFYVGGAARLQRLLERTLPNTQAAHLIDTWRARLIEETTTA